MVATINLTLGISKLSLGEVFVTTEAWYVTEAIPLHGKQLGANLCTVGLGYRGNCMQLRLHSSVTNLSQFAWDFPGFSNETPAS